MSFCAKLTGCTFKRFITHDYIVLKWFEYTWIYIQGLRK